MLVKELITALQALPQESHVLLHDADTGQLFADPEITDMEDQPVVVISSKRDYRGKYYHTTTDFVESLK